MIYFNSIKVRLELQNAEDIEDIIQFQFHKGTIRTLWATEAWVYSDISIP